MQPFKRTNIFTLTKDLYLVREFLVCRPRFHFFQAALGLGLLSTVVNYHFLELKTRKHMTMLACEKNTPDISQSLINGEKKETHKLDQHTACQPHKACIQQHLFH